MLSSKPLPQLATAPPQLPNVGKLRLNQSCHSSDAGQTDSEGPNTLAPAAGGAEARTGARTSDGGTTKTTTSDAGTTDTRESNAGMPVHEGTRGLPIADSPDAGVIIEEGTPYGGTHEEGAYLATFVPPPADHQTEHPDVPVEVSLTHFSVPWSRGASATSNLIRSDTSKSPFSSPRPPGSWITPGLGPDARDSFNIEFKSTSQSYTQMTTSTEADQSRTADSNISETLPEPLDEWTTLNSMLFYICSILCCTFSNCSVTPSRVWGELCGERRLYLSCSAQC